MPAANQGSKGALITWTVVATVFGIICAVLALFAYAGQQNAEQERDTQRQRYQSVATDADLSGSEFSDLKAEAGSQGLLRYSVNRAAQFAERATGSSDLAAARDTIDTTVQRVNSTVENSRATSLLQATENALAGYRSAQSTVTDLQSQIDDLRSKMENQATVHAEELKAMNDQIANAQGQRTEAIAANSQVTENVGKLISDNEEQLQQIVQEMATALADRDNTVADLRGQLSAAGNALDRVTEKLISRIGGEQMVTQPDGRVIRSPQENRLTIDLGRRNSIARGMTFEVYDATRGIPAVNGDPDAAANQELPVGKASIEIVRVGATSSEARLIRTQPGQVVREGDLIANLAYDRNTPIRFRIFGEFDLENDGNASTQDRERLESLVREFGGDIVGDVTVDTDVVVLGKQPELPTFTEEELQNPVNQNLLFQARQRLEAYNAVVDKARQFNKTIVNQNQLLYYIGYFSQAQR